MITAEKRGRKYFAYYYEKNCRLRGSLEQEAAMSRCV